MCIVDFSSTNDDFDARQDLACHRFRDWHERISKMRLDHYRSYNGTYIWGRYLGYGGYGIVSVAWKPFSPNHLVAIKQLHTRENKGGIIDRHYGRLMQKKVLLREEAQLLQTLDHPNIIKLRDFWEEPGDESKRYKGVAFAVGDISLIMDLYAGDLESLLQKEELISSLRREDLVRSVGKQLLQALEYCHGRGIIHRDLKPGNILWKTKPGNKHCEFHFVLADFGMAKTDLSKLNPDFTPKQYFWYSPEYYDRPSKLTVASDVWMLGVSLLWLADENELRGKSQGELTLPAIWIKVKESGMSKRWKGLAKIFAKDVNQRLRPRGYNFMIQKLQSWPKLDGMIAPLPKGYQGAWPQTLPSLSRSGCWHSDIRSPYDPLEPRNDYVSCERCDERDGWRVAGKPKKQLKKASRVR